MAGVNTNLNYSQSKKECHDKLVDLCNKWEMDNTDKSTMTLEVDDDFMSTIYSTVRLLELGMLDKTTNIQNVTVFDNRH